MSLYIGLSIVKRVDRSGKESHSVPWPRNILVLLMCEMIISCHVFVMPFAYFVAEIVMYSLFARCFARLSCLLSCKTAKLGRRDVAVKTLKAGESSKSDAEDLDRELHVLQLLHHPKIVRLAGAGTMPEVRVFCGVRLVQ